MMNTNSAPSLHRVTLEVIRLAVLAAVIFAPALAFGGQPGPLQRLGALIDAVKATPGCLGVEVATTSSNKQTLFAWFENKQAVLNWYYSETHQRMMRGAPKGAFTGHPPLHQVTTDGPIMVIASFAFSPEAAAAGAALPVSQIGIELYAPLPGGIGAGGRFAPSAVKVPGLLEVPLQ